MFLLNRAERMSRDISIDVVNLSTVFGYLARDDRPEAATAAGFEQAESWWEFNSASPSDADVNKFVSAIERSGLRLVAINAYGGDRAAGERGITCFPDRTDEFRASIDSLCKVAELTGARKFNVTIGCMDESRWPRELQFETAAKNYRWAAGRVAEFGGMILVEALSGEDCKNYPFHDGRDVVAFIKGYLPDVENVRYLFDSYHLAVRGLDLSEIWRETVGMIGHVQLADYPGRGALGTGDIDFETLLDVISESNYRGQIALEYFD